MKLVELYHKVEALKNQSDEWNLYPLTGAVDNLPEKKRDEKHAVERFERAKAGVKNFEELLNQLIETLATNYINVDGVKLSLASALWYIKGEKKSDKPLFTLADVSCTMYTPYPYVLVEGDTEFPPRLSLLDKMDFAAKQKINHKEEIETEKDLFLVDPYNLDISAEYKSNFLLKLKAEVACAMAEIEVR